MSQSLEERPSRTAEGWYTPDQLVELGYRAEALSDLFGPPSAGPDGVYGWEAVGVFKVEREVLAPAARLIWATFQNTSLAAPGPELPRELYLVTPHEQLMSRVNYRESAWKPEPGK